MIINGHSMEAVTLNFKEELFQCQCGWIGGELELDIISGIEHNLVCCPCCGNDDIRVLNEE